MVVLTALQHHMLERVASRVGNNRDITRVHPRMQFILKIHGLWSRSKNLELLEVGPHSLGHHLPSTHIRLHQLPGQLQTEAFLMEGCHTRVGTHLEGSNTRMRKILG